MNSNKYCIPGYEDKKAMIFTRRHWASLLGSLFLILFLVILPIVIFILVVTLTDFKPSGFVPNFLLVAASVYYMTMTTFAFIEFINFYYNILMVTEDEVIEIIQAGIFDRRISEISLIRIQDVSARVKGFLPTFFGYGDVVVESAGENTQKYIISCVPHPVEIASEILRLHNAQIERETRRGEAVVGEGDFRKTPPVQESTTPTPSVSVPPAEVEQKIDHRIEEDHQNDKNNENNENNEGDISKDDLNKGGEIKF